MSSDLIQRLQRLQRGFSAPYASGVAALALFDEAQAFKSICGTVGLQEPAEVTGGLVALAQQFGTLGRQLLGAAASNPAALATRFDAACMTIQGCALLLDRLPLGHSDAFRLASSLELVFSAGLHFLQLRKQQNLAALLAECKNQLAAVGTTLQSAVNPHWQPQAAAAFVRTTGRPQAVLPWLLEVSQALLAVSAGHEREVYTQAAGAYSLVACCLLDTFGTAYSDAMQQAPATQQAVLSVLLDRCLLLLAADFSPETLADACHAHCHTGLSLAFALHSACLTTALAERLAQPQGLCYIQQALRVVAALPQRLGTAAGQAMCGEQHAAITALLACLCAPRKGINLPASTAAAAAQLYVETIPRIAATLAGVTADNSDQAERLAGTCLNLLRADAGLVVGEPVPISSDSQLASWAAAADAAVRLVPALLQFHQRCQSLAEKRLRRAPALLAYQLLAGLLSQSAPAAVYVEQHRTGQQPGTEHAQLMRQLWALHTNICRLVAWLAADPSGAQQATLSQLQFGLNSITVLVMALCYLLFTISAANRGVFSDVCLHGIYSAHWAALQTAVQLHGGLSQMHDLLPWCAVNLHHLLDNWLLSLDASLASTFCEVLERLAPVLAKRQLDKRVEAAAQEAATAACSIAPMAVELARGNTLRALLEEAQRLAHSGDACAAGRLVVMVWRALGKLDDSAADLQSHRADATAQQRPLLQQLQHATGVSAGLECSGEAGDAALLAQLPDLSSRLPAAAKLADLLHQWWQPSMQPERHAEAQLALAQAAATRSCAYLRCANLGGEGGPAAGEGAGSMRCSACRAVWYCGTVCSHADWREGGHRRVCKALGAARQAAKEAAAAAAVDTSQGG